jgi:hypothetical protein
VKNTAETRQTFAAHLPDVSAAATAVGVELMASKVIREEYSWLTYEALVRDSTGDRWRVTWVYEPSDYYEVTSIRWIGRPGHAGTVVVPSLVPDRQVTVSAPKGRPPGHVEVAVLVDGAPTAAVLSPDQALDVAAAVTRAIEGGESR